MKKFAFTLILAFVCLVSAAQQPHKTLLGKMKHGLMVEQISKSVQKRLNYTERLDSIVSGDIDNRKVVKFIYDDCENLSIIISSYYHLGSLIDASKTVYEYDENNYCILDADYEWRNEDWEESEKYEYVYDSNGNCLSEIYYLMEMPQWKYLETFDSDNNCLTEEYWYYYSSSGWNSMNRTENTYDTNGNLILRLLQVGDYEGGWISDSKNEYEYDLNDKMISDLCYDWDVYLQDWKLKRRTEFSYDANNNLICKMIYDDYYTYKREYAYNNANCLVSEIYMQLSENGDEWQNKTKSEYVYDQNDSLLLVTNYYGSGVEWHYYDKTEYVRNETGYVTSKITAYSHDDIWSYLDCFLYDYDGHDRLICMIHKIWNDLENGFVDYSKDVYEFDIQGNIIYGAFYYYEDGWIMDESFENTYDLTVDAANILGLSIVFYDLFANTLPVEENPLQNKWLSCRCYVEDGEENLLTLYYSDSYDVDENESSSLKIYSSEGTLSVENDAVANIQVFDMQGRLVAQQNQVTQCRFNLKPGVYVVKAGNASVKTVVK